MIPEVMNDDLFLFGFAANSRQSFEDDCLLKSGNGLIISETA